MKMTNTPTNIFKTAFEAGLNWDDYLASSGDHADAWREARGRVCLSDSQKALLQDFDRSMQILVVSGAWCGDCVRQGPVLAAFADACPLMHLRFIDRDDSSSPISMISINDGNRVPVVIFMAEDGALVSTYGDRTLSYYRWMAAKTLGPACPVPGAPIPEDVLASVTQDWLNECERVQLLLRLSPRLRAIHSD